MLDELSDKTTPSSVRLLCVLLYSYFLSVGSITYPLAFSLAFDHEKDLISGIEYKVR